MPRARERRRTGYLAQLERQLSELDSQRHRLLAQIKAAVDHLAFGSAAPMAGLDLQARAGGRRGRRNGRTAGAANPRRRNVSPEVRARLSQLAKQRWAKAKKAGKTRLG